METSGAIVAVASDGDESAPSIPGSLRARAGPPALMAELICEMIRDPGRANRRSLRSVCDDLGLDKRQVHGWLIADEKFRVAYDLARCDRHDDIAEECLEIADDRSRDDLVDPAGRVRPNKEWIARSRVRIDTRLELLARFDPKKWGAKLQVDADVKTRSLNINVSIDPVQAASDYQDMMRDS